MVAMATRLDENPENINVTECEVEMYSFAFHNYVAHMTSQMLSFKCLSDKLATLSNLY